MPPSYAHGAGAAPLLGETIGENLDRTIARVGDHDALVSVHQDVRYTYAELGEAVDRLARALLATGIATGRPARHLEPELRGVGARAVRDGAGRHRAGQHQPRLPHVGAGVRARAVGLPRARRRAGVQELGLRGDDRRGAGRPAGARAGRVPRLGRVGGADGRRRRRAAGDAVRRGDQHPVHERHHRLPQGRDAQPPQHPQQRLLHRRGLRLLRARPGLHPGAVLPLLRHGARQPRLHDARGVHGDPGARVRSRRDAGGGRGGALHEPLRRADDVHRRARARALRRVRPVHAPHGHHGRLAVPDRDDAARRLGDAHGGGHDLLRHDRDLARVDADGRRRPARQARVDGRARASARRGQGRSTRRPARSCRAASGASCAPAATA